MIGPKVGKTIEILFSVFKKLLNQVHLKTAKLRVNIVH